MYTIKTSEGQEITVHGEEQFAEEVAAAITSNLYVDTTVKSSTGKKLHEFYADRSLD